MARPKVQTPLRQVVEGLEQTEALLKRLQDVYPDLRRMPVAKREAVKDARAKLEEAAAALRKIVEADARTPVDLDPPGK